MEEVHVWQAHRPCCGEMVQWNSSEHDWLEGRGPKLSLVAMLDDATSRAWARFTEHDLAAILSHVEERVVANDYTIQYNTNIYQITRTDIRPDLPPFLYQS